MDINDVKLMHNTISILMTMLEQKIKTHEEKNDEPVRKRIKNVPSSNGMGMYQVDVENQTCTCPAFHYMRIKNPNYLCKHIESVPDTIIEVPSMTNESEKYKVNVTKQTCTCKSFQFRKVACKHIKSLKMDETEDIGEIERGVEQVIEKERDLIVEIDSTTKSGTKYIVNVTKGTCDCPDFVYRRQSKGQKCKHLMENSKASVHV